MKQSINLRKLKQNSTYDYLPYMVVRKATKYDNLIEKVNLIN